MDLRAYLSLFWRRKQVIVMTIVVTITFVAVGLLLIEPTYSASATLRLASVSRASDDWAVLNMEYADRLMNTYAEIASSAPLLMSVAADLGLAESLQVDVQLQANTELMEVSAEHRDPVLAAEIANAVAKKVTDLSREQAAEIRQTAQSVFLDQLIQLDAELTQAELEYAVMSMAMPESGEIPSAARRAIELKRSAYDELLEQRERSRLQEALQVRTLTLLGPATAPTAPAKPDIALNAALGLIMGLAGGLALAFFVEVLDTTLYTSDEIKQATQSEILAEVPILSTRHDGKLTDDSTNVEVFRHLRTNLIGLGSPLQFKTAIITSPEAGEGKSTIAANLAVAIAQSGQTIALVDADLRLPVLHKLFGLPNTGLSNVLQGEIDLDGALRTSAVPGLAILASGAFSPKSTELLASPKMAEVIEQLRERFTMVLFDTPALLAVADASVLASMVEGAVLIIGQGQTRRESAEAAYRQLEKTRVPWIGLVVNRTTSNTNHYRYFHKTAMYRRQPWSRWQRSPIIMKR